jgi:hypothetical protein
MKSGISHFQILSKLSPVLKKMEEHIPFSHLCYVTSRMQCIPENIMALLPIMAKVFKLEQYFFLEVFVNIPNFQTSQSS